jgi:hypothetical protein
MGSHEAHAEGNHPSGTSSHPSSLLSPLSRCAPAVSLTRNIPQQADRIFDTIFSLKFTGKQLAKQAQKLDKDAQGYRKKAYKSRQENNLEAAKSYINVRGRGRGNSRANLGVGLFLSLFY